MSRRSAAQASETLDRELANATLRALRAAYRQLNDGLFGGKLTPPTLSRAIEGSGDQVAEPAAFTDTNSSVM